MPATARYALRLAALGTVVLLLSSVLGTRLLAGRAEAAHPALGETVVVEGLRQHVLVRGTGPPVVFVHGAYGALQDFVETILDEAATRYRCVLWDRPGHGYSERPAGAVDPGVQAELLLALVRRLELDRPLLVGFSYGGAVCLAAGLAAPDELRGIVLVNGPSHPWPDPLELEYRLASVPLLGWLLSETVVPPLGHLLGDAAVAAAFAPLPVSPAFERSPTALALRPHSYRANAEDIALLKPFLRAQVPRYPELDVPITALVATGDTVVSPTIHVPQLERQAPDVRQLRIEGAGHQLLYTHPDLVLDAIDATLAR